MSIISKEMEAWHYKGLKHIGVSAADYTCKYVYDSKSKTIYMKVKVWNRAYINRPAEICWPWADALCCELKRRGVVASKSLKTKQVTFRLDDFEILLGMLRIKGEIK
ncbi:hypothetical protein IKN40_08730 [bacterium]|nr:hypothetical protein [Clostridia bacterium]MBR4617938.1 hypothetical protein [Bacilli bacterium]MBR6908503.1 hypothetical protein [bacterium]